MKKAPATECRGRLSFPLVMPTGWRVCPGCFSGGPGGATEGGRGGLGHAFACPDALLLVYPVEAAVPHDDRFHSALITRVKVTPAGSLWGHGWPTLERWPSGKAPGLQPAVETSAVRGEPSRTGSIPVRSDQGSLFLYPTSRVFTERNGTTGGIGGLFEKMFHYFQFQRDEFLAHYHKRSNVESTFSAVKRKFGDSVRSKTDAAMKNEVLCKLLAHNLTCLIQEEETLGIAPMFFKDEQPPALAVVS